ncbi:hypothetical protein B9Z55_003269 [Caenorhabditis nigoni]|uniref:Uncharacterized protein n=1 Tax=Caenorhabditis nigoni TaxID=1611254 RepID=A0A2G5VP99_9PELO|nr:hypothetical protein B9Z55_003269 [Caenorhabditis nigoni]
MAVSRLPAPCPCDVKGIDDTNIVKYAGSSRGYEEVVAYPISTPTIIQNDCVVKMNCPKESKLTLIHTNALFPSVVGFQCDRNRKIWKYSNAFELKGLYGTCQDTAYPTNFSCPEFQLLHGSGNIKISGVSEFQDTEAPVVDSLKSYPPSPGACYKTLSCTGNYRDLYYYKHGDDNAYFIAHLPYVNSTEQLYASIAYHPVKKQYVVNGKAENVRAFTCGSQETQ